MTVTASSAAAASLSTSCGPHTRRGPWNPTSRAWVAGTAACSTRRGGAIPTGWNQMHYHTEGTSTSAPQMAAVVALVNDALLAEGSRRWGS